MNQHVQQGDNKHHGQQPSDEIDRFDVVIVGGGIVGLCFAHALIDTDFSVAIIERNELDAIAEQTSCRVSAINLSALKYFQQTGVLHSPLAQRICHYEKMFVWEQAGAGQIQFDSAELGVSALGAIIENNVLQQLLLEKVQQAGNIHYFCPQEITHIDYMPINGVCMDEASSAKSENYRDDDSVDSEQTASASAVSGGAVSTIVFASGKKIQATLLVGADGVNSKVSAAASISRTKHSYNQQALVCNVATSEHHQNTAWQCFMAHGPLAFLPLYNGQSSIVWSLDDSVAQQTLALDEQAFKLALAEASEFVLGEITAVSQRYLFPLTHGHASDYVQPGLALIGDAAHNIHPLAGQGANLGIADAFALAEIIIGARKARRQWAALHTLSKYQRQRKGANQLMEASMTGFKQLFGNNNALLSEIRNAGLSLVDNLPALKYRIIKQALGV